MTITFTADRIKLQAENERESQDICDLLMQLDNYALSDEIYNAHGSENGLNFITLPLPAITEAGK